MKFKVGLYVVAYYMWLSLMLLAVYDTILFRPIPNITVTVSRLVLYLILIIFALIDIYLKGVNVGVFRIARSVIISLLIYTALSQVISGISPILVFLIIVSTISILIFSFAKILKLRAPAEIIIKKLILATQCIVVLSFGAIYAVHFLKLGLKLLFT